MIDELSQTLLVRILGLLFFFRLLGDILYYIYDYIHSKYFGTDVTTLGEWAVITGATDGIGYAFAREIANLGINILLISRSEEKLKERAREIEKDFRVKTSYIQADFGDRNCYGKIRAEIKNYDIGILVNNVGTLVPMPTDFISLSEEHLLKEIDVNCTSAVIMTRLVLPDMERKKKGLIINISSLSTETGLPRMGLYCATKTFLNTFSLHIQEEVSDHNIKVLCLIPGPIRTKLIQEADSGLTKFNNKLPAFSQFFIEPSTYTKNVIKQLSSVYTVFTGYHLHTIMGIMNWMPYRLRLKLSKLHLTMWKP